MADIVQGMVLRIVRYSDTASIATAWTWQHGRMSLLLPSGSGREAQRRRAIMMPMAVFEGVLIGQPNAEVRKLRDVRSLQSSPASTGHPVRNVVAQFLAEFLNAVLRESQPDERLNQYLAEGMQVLSRAHGLALANFHLLFLYHLGHFLGIEPDAGTYQQDAYFDMKEGLYTMVLPVHRLWLQHREARMAWLLGRASWRHLPLFRFTRQQRNAALDVMVQYYGLHHTDVSKLPSMSIIHQIFE